MMIGTRFERLEVIGIERDGAVTYAVVRCDCGIEKYVRVGNLTNGKTRSCGCLARERPVWMHGYKHGMSKHPYYRRWQHMMGRCYDSRHHRYAYYGARGIRVYEPWHDAGVFIAYLENVLGPCPSGCTLDRIDNDSNYVPGNIRWATAQEQNRNRRRLK